MNERQIEARRWIACAGLALGTLLLWPLLAAVTQPPPAPKPVVYTGWYWLDDFN